MAIFDISKKVATKIYSSEEISGGNVNSHTSNQKSKYYRDGIQIKLFPLITPCVIFINFSLLGVGGGDITFNARRNILGSVSVGGEIAYHLHNIEYPGQKGSPRVQLLRKSR